MISSMPPLPVTQTPASLPPADLYIRVRQKEGRIYPDEIVSRLPDFPDDHPLTQEWLARADSSRRLLTRLGNLPRPLHVLDLGCGNGWLARLIAGLPGTRVWGVDRPGPELLQAARLSTAPNAAFFTADIARAPLPRESCDAIVLASVIQYFPDLAALLRQLRTLLRPGGEIHILDSPLYAAAELDAARQRTAAYYSGLGFPEMAASYFHHTASALAEFRPEYLYRPRAVTARISRQLGRVTSPFPWIRIRQAT